MMTRHSIRTYETAGHPLRRAFPQTRNPLLSREPMGDLQLFAMTFAAGFLAFMGFLA